MADRRPRHSSRPVSKPRPQILLRIYRLYTDAAGTTVRSERIYRANGKVYDRTTTTGPGRQKLQTRWTIIGRFTPRALEMTRTKKIRNGWVEI